MSSPYRILKATAERCFPGVDFDRARSAVEVGEMMVDQAERLRNGSPESCETEALTAEDMEIVDVIVDRHRREHDALRTQVGQDIYQGMLARQAFDALEHAHRETVIDRAHVLAVAVLERLANQAGESG